MSRERPQLAAKYLLQPMLAPLHRCLNTAGKGRRLVIGCPSKGPSSVFQIEMTQVCGISVSLVLLFFPPTVYSEKSTSQTFQEAYIEPPLYTSPGVTSC